MSIKVSILDDSENNLPFIVAPASFLVSGQDTKILANLSVHKQHKSFYQIFFPLIHEKKVI